MLDFTNGSKPKSSRIKFEMSESMVLVVENEYCKIYNDKRSGKPFKVINDEVVPLELREFNMWKNRQKNPANFVVDVINDENGNVYDYVISRVSANGAKGQNARSTPAPESPTPALPNAPSAPNVSTPAPKAEPQASAPRAVPPVPQPSVQSAVPPVPQPSAPRAVTPAPQPASSETRTTTAVKPSRIKFEQTPTTELVLTNEYFSIYKDTRSGKTFKVINDEVAPIELRELNMWKNRQKDSGNFVVEILKDEGGQIFDYTISRASASAAPSVQPVQSEAPKAEPAPTTAPVLKKEESEPKEATKAEAETEQIAEAESEQKAEPKPEPSAPAASNRVAPSAPSSQKKPAARSVPSVTNSVGTPPTDRVKFEQTPTTEVVVENEFCKIYKDTRSGKTFKVINDMIAPIELRELNMWKNRQKNPGNFTVEIIKDSAGTPFDYIISRINEDGTLTKAPAVAPVAPYIPPENDYVPASDLSVNDTAAKKAEPVKPAQVFPVGKPDGALPVTESKEKAPAVNDRIKFEETPTMSVVVDNEFFKIYNDSRRGKTFKVINGMIAPIELRELNMWKNRQRKPKNFAIEVIKTESGEVYDYKITRTEKSTTAAVESTSTKTNMPPVTDAPNSNTAAKKRRPNSNRVSKCAICGDEYGESELFLFDNRNFCTSCLEKLVKEKLDFKPVDPIQKVIDDVVAADELYCTYSTVTNYPYLDEEFCVNVCTVKRAAEIALEDTAVQTIDDKGVFFDDLKRFGLKKIIVNNDSSHVFAPQDFDEHVKTEGVIAPKLYFKILNFMQRKDDELRETIAASFLGSKVYTYALNDDITEITDENIDDFKPLTITDGHANFCPVFTDFTEARNVGMPFRGLYEIETRLLTGYNITHFIINPSSLGFIMNKSILNGVEPNYDRDLIGESVSEEISEKALTTDEAESEENTSPEAPAYEETVVSEIVEPVAEEIISEPVKEKVIDEELITTDTEEEADAFAPISDFTSASSPIADQFIAQPTAPAADQFVAQPTAPVADQFVAQPTAPVADQFVAQPTALTADQFAAQPTAPAADQFIAQPTAPVADQFVAQPTTPAADQFVAQPTAPTANQFAAQPTTPIADQFAAKQAPTPVAAAPAPAEKEKKSGTPEIVIKSDSPDGTKKTFKVSMPIFIPDDPDADIETNTSVSSSLQNAIKKSQSMFGDNSMPSFGSKPADEPIKPAEKHESSGGFSFNDIMSDLASENDDSGSLDLSSLMMNAHEEEPPAPPKPKLSIQTQATETKVIARDLEIEPDIRVAQILRDQLNESYRKLAKMISEADVMYAEYDSNTKHILIDGNNKGHIFSEKMYADKSVENFARSGISVYIKEYKREELFIMLYEYKRHGIQDLVLDETANWVIISTDTIADMLDVNERKFVPIPVNNPELMFAMTTLFQKLQSKNDNPKRKQEIQSLEKLMIREFTSARYILPMVAYDEHNIRPLSIDGKNGVKRILVFSDAFEMKRFFGDKINIVKDYEIVTYKELIKKFTVMSNTVVVLNEGSLRFEFNDHNCDHINKVINQ